MRAERASSDRVLRGAGRGCHRFMVHEVAKRLSVRQVGRDAGC